MKVSVLINNYNYAPYLAACIDSVLKQSYANIEIIIYDDGSSDNSLDIIKKYGDCLTLIGKPNYGKYPSFNQGNAIYEAFKVSTGEIICLLDSDDCFVASKVEKIVTVFKNQPEISMVQHRMQEIDLDGNPNGNFKKKGIIITENPLEMMYKTKRIDQYFMQTSALSFRRDFLEKHLPFDETNFEYVWPDVRLTRTVLFSSKFKTMIEPLSQYRVHPDNDSKKLSDKNYYYTFLKQQQDFINQLASKSGKKTIIQKSGIGNKIVTLFIVLFSRMDLKSKKMFFFDLLK